MLPKNIITELIDTYGADLVPISPASPTVHGIFAKQSELIPSLMPYCTKGNSYIAFYAPEKAIISEAYTYAEKRWLALACKTVDIDGSLCFSQAILRHDPYPDAAFTIIFSFGGISVNLTVSKAEIKQGSLIVNIAAINNFVADTAVGSEPLEITVYGKVAKTDAILLVNELKNPAPKDADALSVGSVISTNAVVKNFCVTES